MDSYITRNQPPPIPPRSPLRLLAATGRTEAGVTTLCNAKSEARPDDYSLALNHSIDQFLNRIDANSFSRASYDCNGCTARSMSRQSLSSQSSIISAASSCYGLPMAKSPLTSCASSSGLNAPPLPRLREKSKTLEPDDTSLSRPTTMDFIFDMVDQLATTARTHADDTQRDRLSTDLVGRPAEIAAARSFDCLDVRRR